MHAAAAKCYADEFVWGIIDKIKRAIKSPGIMYFNDHATHEEVLALAKKLDV
jgi:hypothetical protein